MCTRDLGVRQGMPRGGRQGALGTKKNCKKAAADVRQGQRKERKNLLSAFCFKWYPKADARCQLWIPLLTNRLREGKKSSLSEKNAREQVSTHVLTSVLRSERG